MVSLVIYFLISCVVLWLLVMYGIWRKEQQIKSTSEIYTIVVSLYNKILRLLRRGWFYILRFVQKIRIALGNILIKLFFILFPKAKKVFNKRDELTGLEHGPSSYFLMSVSEYKSKFKNSLKKDRRNKKNV